MDLVDSSASPKFQMVVLPSSHVSQLFCIPLCNFKNFASRKWDDLQFFCSVASKNQCQKCFEKWMTAQCDGHAQLWFSDPRVTNLSVIWSFHFSSFHTGHIPSSLANVQFDNEKLQCSNEKWQKMVDCHFWCSEFSIGNSKHDKTPLHCFNENWFGWTKLSQCDAIFDAPKSSTDKCQLAGTSDEAQNGNQMIFLIHITFQRWQNQQWWQGLNIFAWSMHISSLCNRLCICWLQNNAQWNDFIMQRNFLCQSWHHPIFTIHLFKMLHQVWHNAWNTSEFQFQGFDSDDQILQVLCPSICFFVLSVNVYYFACFMICLQFLKCFIALWHSQERMAFWHTFWINPQQQTKTRARRM